MVGANEEGGEGEEKIRKKMGRGEGSGNLPLLLSQNPTQTVFLLDI